MVRLAPKTEAFSPSSGKLGGRIVVFEDEHGWALEGSIVFLNVGRSDGVRPGDYFTIYVTDRKALITFSVREIYLGEQIELQ